MAISYPPRAARMGERVAGGHGRLVGGQGPGHDLGLAGHAGGVEAGAGAGDLDRVEAEEGAVEGGGRGGVADAHVAGAEAADAFGRGAFGQGEAQVQGFDAIFAAHGRTASDVGRARGDFGLDQRGMLGERAAGHAGVDHQELDVVAAGEHVDAGAAGQEVGDHLASDFARGDAHAFGHHAVVAGHGEDARRVHGRRRAAADDVEAQGQLFQPAEASPGLGQVVEVGLGRWREAIVNRGDGGQACGESSGHGGSLAGIRIARDGRR